MFTKLASIVLSLLLPLSASLPVTAEATETPAEEPVFLATIESLPRSGRTQRMSQEERNRRRVLSHSERLRELRTLRRVAHKKPISARVSLERVLGRTAKLKHLEEKIRQERRRLLAKALMEGRKGRRVLKQEALDRITKGSCSFSHPKGYINPCLAVVRPRSQKEMEKAQKKPTISTKEILRELGPKRRLTPAVTRRVRVRPSRRSVGATFERQTSERMQTLERLREGILEQQWKPHYEWDRD